MSFPVISLHHPLILASASARRKKLLTQIGLPFVVVTSQVSEDGITGDPAHMSCILAEKKAREVQPNTEGSWILGADTMVVIGDKILRKPEDAEKARQMLMLLSGREHQVITGFCILDPSGNVAHSEAVTTLVRIKGLTGQEIQAYINTAEPFGKAGSYAIQGIGSFMVEAISGSYTNVVGLPLCALTKSLLAVGALKNFPLPENL